MKKYTCTILTFILINLSSNLFAQLQPYWNWYFGNGAAVNFSTGSPVAVAGCAMSTVEGCATISDNAGNLLFYTDGITAWDRTNTPMPNGSGLWGNASSTESGIIVPKPGSTTQYYLFTTDCSGGHGTNWYLVDMTLNAGLGAVVSNVATNVEPNTTEKLTAVRHANGTDYWVICHGVNDNTYYACQVSAGGVAAPVISNAGTVYTGTLGYLKASPNGLRLAANMFEQNLLDVLDFNPCTGVVSFSNPITLTVPPEFAYGVSFSPNNSVLYEIGDASPAHLVQFDLSSNVQATIQASLYNVTLLNTSGGALQIGPDGKMYVCNYNSSFLNVINNPNVLGVGCNYVNNAVSLGAGTCMIGLPNILDAINVITNTVSLPTDTTVCTAPVVLDPGPGGATYTWSTGANTEAITVNTSGIYSVVITGDTVCGVTTTAFDTVTVTITGSPVVNLGNDTTLCQGQTLTLNAGNPGDTYLWSTGANTQTITVNANGTYWVNVSVGACADTDTIIVTFVPGPVVNLGNDTTLCSGQPITLNAGNPGDTYLWSNGAMTQTISPTTSGIYWVHVTSNGSCVATDSITLTFTPLPIVNLGPDQSLCNGTTATFDAGNPGDTYLWSNGAVTESITVSNAGQYWVQVSNGTCTGTDTVKVTTGLSAPVNLGPDIHLCNGASTTLDAGNPGMNYLWSNGATTQTISVTSSGTYYVNVSNNGCSGSDTVNVTIAPPLTVSLGPDTTICPGDQMVIDAGKGYSSYAWIPGGESSHFIIINQPGTYGLTVLDSNGCMAKTSIWVADFCPSDMYVPSAFAPDGNNFNTVFMAYCENVIQFHMYIYNRWGQLVFESEDISKGWDGTFNGQMAPQGTYVYRVDYQLYDFVSLHKHTKVGSVTLIR